QLFGIDLLAEAPGSAELLARLNERDSAKSVAAERDLAMEKFLKYARGGK
ncbi:MAG TPA: glutathione S-transferase, partial [Alcanivorax sp.]|nr:glutathione S-transferase [Alcanivorax sp.]